MADFTPRPHQEEILTYRKGTMGIAAVPGSGKTWTLSKLAAKVIKDKVLEVGQEILIVTLTNSAVDNFSARINEFLYEGGSPPLIPPYRVRTLHGLAHDIVRERPDLVGLDPAFSIIDDRAANQIRNDVTNSWLGSKPTILDNYLSPSIDEKRIDWVRGKLLPGLIQSVSNAFIRTAKNYRQAPSDLKKKLESLPVRLPLAEMGTEIYTRYQRALAYQCAVDFDDLIWLAYRGLDSDNDFLMRLRYRWPYILEDEAQDSSELQEQILRLLVGEEGNWVRVGDPNQAIFESFTTANPKYLQDFIRQCDHDQKLPTSGRSTKSIIDLANALVDWTRLEHPNQRARTALDAQHIEPTLPGDPQPNPKDNPEKVKFIAKEYSSEGEIKAVAESLAEWVSNNQNKTVGVLVPSHHHGEELVKALIKMGIKVEESLLRTTISTRKTTGALGNILNYLGDPGNPRLLARIYQVWRRKEFGNPKAKEEIDAGTDLLAKCKKVEDFLWPRPGRDWLNEPEITQAAAPILDSFITFREIVKRWQGSVLLPINQVVLTIAQDLFEETHELALVHKLAQLLRQVADTNPGWGFRELAGELSIIAKNERRFLGFSEDDTGFDTEKYKGIVVISTMHKAKGLEWDRVHLMSINEYDFPSGKLADKYYPEKWFIRETEADISDSNPGVRLNLEAETLSQLETLIKPEVHDFYEEGHATREARLDFIRERLRLFYVGITRAREELIITFNKGRYGDKKAALPMLELAEFWEDYLDGIRRNFSA